MTHPTRRTGTNMKRLIFRTVHGSHLYGLAHEGSDLDYYEVYEGDRTQLHQTTNGITDVVRGDLAAFTTRALTGSHQSCEALFSPVKEWAPGMEAKWGAYLDGFRVGGGDVYEKYERTIRKFTYLDFKRRRHAVRLAFSLHALRREGRFNPVMDDLSITLANKLASIREGDDLAEALGVLQPVAA